MATEFPDNIPDIDDERFKQVYFDSDNDRKMQEARDAFRLVNMVDAEQTAIAAGFDIGGNPVASKVFTDNPGSAVALQPAEGEAAAASAPASEAHEMPATQALNEPAPDAAAIGSSKGAQAQGQAEAAGGLPESPRQATDLERSMAQIRGDANRQDRVVMLGDPVVERRMYQMLEFQGKVTYRGGVPHVSMSSEKLAKAYNLAAKDLNQRAGQEENRFGTIHAVTIHLNREPAGVFGELGASIKNALGRQHTVTVLVGGDEAARAKGMQELNQLVGSLAENKMLSDASLAKLKTEDERFELKAGDGPVQLASTRTLDVAVALAAEPVWQREAYIRKLDELTQEARHAKDAGNLKEDKPDAQKQATAKEKVKVNTHTLKFSVRLNEAIAQPSTLQDKNEKGQPTAEILIYIARGLRAPEFATLPEDKRQLSLVQLEALSLKVADKEYGKDVAKILAEPDKTHQVSFKEKLAQLIDAEKARDPDFTRKADVLAKELVASGFITEQQAQSLTTTKSVEATADAVKAPAADAAQTASVTTGTAAAQTEADSGKSAGMEAIKLDRDAPLYERIEQIAKAGPDAVTNDQVTTLLKDLRVAKDTEDVTLVDGRGVNDFSSDEPTKTLTRLEAIVDAAAAGRFGPEAQAEAKDMKPLLEENGAWQFQESDRYYSDPTGARTPADQDRAIKAERAELGSWLGAEASASAGAGSEASSSNNTKEAPQAVSAMDTSASHGTTGTTASNAAAAAPSAELKATEKAVTQLSQLMANPAGSFTTKDHQWDPRGADKLAKAIGDIDSEALKQMTSTTRAEVAAYSEWAARAAQDGKLPVRDDLKDTLVAKATELVGDHKDSAPLNSDATKNLAKAQRLETAMDARATGAGNAQEALGSQPNRDMSGIAKDLVHAVYKAPEMGEAYAKYTLKMASAITPENIRSLSTDDRARTAVALDFLARQVKDGALGDFGALSNAVQRHTTNAIDAADKLYQTYAKDPSMQASMIRAENDLRTRDDHAAGKAAETPGQGGGKAQSGKQAQEAQTSADRSLER